MLAASFHQFSNGVMGTTAQVALHAAIGAYTIAALLALAGLFAPGRVRMKWADHVGAVGTGALAAYFIARFAEAGLAPLSNVFEVVTLSALCLALAYFVATRLKPLPALGGFAFPALAAVFLVSLLFASSTSRTPGAADSGALVILHVILVVLAYGVFFMAAAAATMFLIQERALKRHHTPGYARQFPPLEALRKLLMQCVWIGLPLITAGFALGFGAEPLDRWGSLLLTPKVFTSVVLWLVFVAAVTGKAAGWLHGRRHSWLVLAGFALLIASYAGLALFVRN